MFDGRRSDICEFLDHVSMADEVVDEVGIARWLVLNDVVEHVNEASVQTEDVREMSVEEYGLINPYKAINQEGGRCFAYTFEIRRDVAEDVLNRLSDAHSRGINLMDSAIWIGCL